MAKILTDKTLREQSNKRMTFQVLKNGNIEKSHTLIINPEELSEDEPARVGVTKTIGGAYVEEWGRDLINYTIGGVTGYRKTINAEGKETDGFQAFKELRNDIYRYFLEPDGKMKQLGSQTDIYELRFFDWSMGEYYSILPLKFVLLRSKSRTLLYAYDLSFVALNEINAPNDSDDGADSVLSALAFDEVRKNTEILLPHFADNLRTLFATTTMYNGEVLTSIEALTEINYPGITKYIIRIRIALSFTDMVLEKVRDYNRRTVPYVDVLSSEIEKTRMELRAICEGIVSIPCEVSPFTVLSNLRAIEAQLGLLASYKNYFKESYYAGVRW